MGSTRDDNIAALSAAAMRSREAMVTIEAHYHFPADCCPSCACGPEWHALHGKLERQLDWLKRLLGKRGTERDLQRKKAIEVSNRTDFHDLVAELALSFTMSPALRARVETELHNALVAGREGAACGCASCGGGVRHTHLAGTCPTTCTVNGWAACPEHRPNECRKQLECGGACCLTADHPPPCLCAGDDRDEPGTCPA